MADTYWDHPARRETKRLIDLGDAGAILDELQQGSTEWDDAREALDHLVRGSRAEVERLRTLLRDMTDPDPCRFDHHGGCQAHGYLDLKPGEKCPHAEAKELLALGGTEAGR